MKIKDMKNVKFNNYVDFTGWNITEKEVREYIYNLTLKDYVKLSTLTTKENYNIYKSIDLKLVDENTKYADYFAVTCGFKNKKELLKYTEAVFKLANIEKAS